MTSTSALSLSSDDQRRIAEVEQLARAGTTGLATLVEQLTDPSWAVRRAVVAALARLGDPAIPALSDILVQRRDSEARLAAAVDALTASRSVAVDDAMTRLAEGTKSPAVLCDAIQVLGRRRHARAAPLLGHLAGHADDNVAVAAIEALGRIGAVETVEPLIAAVRSRNFFRAFPAMDALGRTGDDRAIAPLVEVLPDPFYAAEATRALGRTGHAAAIPPLASLLARGPDVLRRAAAVALADLRARFETRFGDPSPIAAALGAYAGTGAIARLVECVAGASPSERIAIARVLGWIGDDTAIAKLIELIDDEPLVGAAAAEALRGLRASATPALLAAIHAGDSARRAALLPLVGAAPGSAGEIALCLDDRDPAVRALACEALARSATTTVVPSLFRLIGDPDARVSQAASAAIQSLGSIDTKRLALQEARSGDLRTRRAAMRIVAYFGYQDGLDVLIQGIADPDDKIRETALQGLPLVDDPRALTALLDVASHPHARTRAAAIRALGDARPGDRVIAAIRGALRDDDAWTRYYACQSLGKLRASACIDDLVTMMSDPAGQVSVAAVEALAHLRGERATAALEDAAKSGNVDIRRAALVGLGIARSPRSLGLLRSAAEDTDASTRLVAIGALSEFDAPEVVPVLAHAASDPDENVRGAAIGFLSTRAGVAATRALVDLLDNPALRDRVVSALAVAADDRVDTMLAALETADADRASILVSALTRIRRPSSQAAIAAALAFENVSARRAAAAALGALGTPEAIGVLARAAASDPDPEVRRIGALAASKER